MSNFMASPSRSIVGAVAVASHAVKVVRLPSWATLVAPAGIVRDHESSAAPISALSLGVSPSIAIRTHSLSLRSRNA